MDLKHRTTEIFREAFENSGMSQKQFGEKVFISQPHIHHILKGNIEITLSSFKKYMKVFGMEYDIVLVKDIHHNELSMLLKKLEVDLIKKFSKEKDYDHKKLLDKKIEAVKLLLDN